MWVLRRVPEGLLGADLYSQGALSPEEFEAAKRRILDN